MTAKAYAVIGAWFGDEGKGLVTDFLASKDPDNTCVVRHNGGAQAGHTVVTPEGIRHVFSHFGAGTLLGCPTYLSRNFICNPKLFVKEWKELEERGIAPKIVVHPKARVSTWLDVAINRFRELGRLHTRHGSVGVGISETVIRSAEDYAIYAEDFFSPLVVSNKLWRIKEEWMTKRLEEVGIVFAPSFIEDQTVDYMSDVRRMRGKFSLSETPPEKDVYIFEGAQGLCLDECRIDQFPYTTHSRTGLTNVVRLCRQWGIEDLTPIYVSRSYVTRHGAGPLMRQFPEGWDKFNNWSDETNVENRWQGKLRYARLDWDMLGQSVHDDLCYATLDFPYLKQHKFFFTHMDQQNAFDFAPKGVIDSCYANGEETGWCSNGPTRNSVQSIDKVLFSSV